MKIKDIQIITAKELKKLNCLEFIKLFKIYFKK